MINNQQRIFESIADTTSRSRLEPYREVILRWRRGRISYRRILKALAANGVTVGRMTLYEFVQRRSRPRTIEPEDPPVELMQPDPPKRKPIRSTEETLLPRRSAEEIAALRAAASAAHHKPAFPILDVPKAWEYDPDRPLTNIKQTTKDITHNVSSRSDRNS